MCRSIRCGVLVCCLLAGLLYAGPAWSRGAAVSPSHHSLGVLRQSTVCIDLLFHKVIPPISATVSLTTLIGTSVTLADGSLGWGISSLVASTAGAVAQAIAFADQMRSPCRMQIGYIALNGAGWAMHVATFVLGTISIVRAIQRRREMASFSHQTDKTTSSSLAKQGKTSQSSAAGSSVLLSSQ